MYEAGLCEGRPYLVMAFVQGESLASLLKRRPSLDEAEILGIVRPLALALAEAHSQRIVHRDLKPSNILIDAKRGQPVLMDFGLARRLGLDESQLTHDGQVLGTPAYMSPEQADGQQSLVGPASDIYSLGVILYELLCGQRPFSGSSMEVVAQILRAPLVPPSQIRPQVSPRLEAICLKAMRREISDRFASMEAFVAALDEADSHEPPPRRKGPSRFVIGLAAAGSIACGIWIYMKSNEPVQITRKDGVTTVTVKDSQAEVKVEPAQPALPAALPPTPRTTSSITNTIGMRLTLVPAGVFSMGDAAGDANERPVRQVTISRDFYIGTYEVTQKEYETVMGSNPSVFKEDDRPVEELSWGEAVEFCSRLSQREGRNYRLPTEAEWEFACRGGTKTSWSFGDNQDEVFEYAWCQENSHDTTHPVGQKRPNPLGLYDMHGNVWEFCSDRQADYPAQAETDPQGPTKGNARVIRGGSYFFPSWESRSSNRPDRVFPAKGRNLGFRVVAET